MNKKPIDQWRSSIFQISKWENESEEYGKYCNYGIQKSYVKQKEPILWDKQTITSLNISEIHRLKVLLDQVISEHFLDRNKKEEL